MRKNYQTYECQPKSAYVYVEVYTYNNFIRIYDVIIYGSAYFYQKNLDLRKFIIEI